MRRTLASLGVLLTIMTTDAMAASVAATPCASRESIDRADSAMQPFLRAASAQAQTVAGMVLLDCSVQASQRLRCTTPSHTTSAYDLSAAALAFAGELEVCPGTPRHLVFPLVFRDGESRPAP